MKNRNERSFLRLIGKKAGVLLGTAEGAANAAESRIAEEQAGEPDNERKGFEESDIQAWNVVLVGAGVLGGTLIALIIAALWASHLQHDRVVSSPPALPIQAYGNPLPPQPQLRAHPAEDLKTLRARESQKINTYRWINQANGQVAIPIDLAMKLLAQRGIPPQKAPVGLALSQPQAGTRQTGFEGKVEPEPQ